jgi:hypothetical protein
MMPGKVFDKKFWCVTDYRDMTVWVYGVDGTQWFVKVAYEAKR